MLMSWTTGGNMSAFMTRWLAPADYVVLPADIRRRATCELLRLRPWHEERGAQEPLRQCIVYRLRDKSPQRLPDGVEAHWRDLLRSKPEIRPRSTSRRHPASEGSIVPPCDHGMAKGIVHR